MKYMLLIHHGSTPTPGEDAWEALSEAEQGQIYADYKALNETPGFTPGQYMGDPTVSTTVRVQGGQMLVTDGPFAEIKDAIGGFGVFEADDLDAAIALAATIPAARMGGGVEIRPLPEGNPW